MVLKAVIGKAHLLYHNMTEGITWQNSVLAKVSLPVFIKLFDAIMKTLPSLPYVILITSQIPHLQSH
jgi:hypothetical protein